MLRILFLSHSYPPIKGGVENQNHNLATGLRKITGCKIIANSKGKLHLLVFVPLTFVRACLLKDTYDACLVGNGVLAPLAAVLKLFFPQKGFFSVVHGLDVTFAGKKGLLAGIYRVVNIPSLKRLDRLFMVGNSTIMEAERMGIPGELCRFIPNGVNIAEFKRACPRDELSKLIGFDVSKKRVILRLSRFVPHKGTHWFIRNVMPKLPENICLVAAGYRVTKHTVGDPDDFDDCSRAVLENNLQKRVNLMTNLSQEAIRILLNTVDMVVSPNVNYPGSLEGFGINAIEAAACGRVVLASNLQGLADAVKDGRNGFLIEPENVDHWIRTITDIFSKGDDFIANFGKAAARFVEENYTWEKITKQYMAEMERAVLLGRSHISGLHS